MRFKPATIEHAVAARKRLKSCLTEHGVEAPLSACGNVIARCLGYDRWSEMKSVTLRDRSHDPYDDAVLESERMTRRSGHLSVLSLAFPSLPSYVIDSIAEEVRPTTHPASAKHGTVPAACMTSNDSSSSVHALPGSGPTDHVNLIYGGHGKGKSTLLNAANLATCAQQLSSRGTLPRISILNIDASSEGIISHLREGLPPNRRNEARYVRLKMDRRSAINPFDTRLGCRYPSGNDGIVELMVALGTPAGSPLPTGIEEIVKFTVDGVYKRFDDRHPGSRPKPYVHGIDNAVDTAMDMNSVTTSPAMTWWDVVDALFENVDYRHAMLAQRHAVPRLSDFRDFLLGMECNYFFSDTRGSDGARTLPILERMYADALAAYPVLQCETRLDIDGARVVSLDLEDVTPIGDFASDKQTAVMYLLARSALVRDFCLNGLASRTRFEVPIMPASYRDYHEARATDSLACTHRLVYDDFHRVSFSDPVTRQVIEDAREARPFGLQVSIASEAISDFAGYLVDLPGGRWILGVHDDLDAREAVEAFELLTKPEVLLRELVGPGPDGVSFLALRWHNGRHEGLTRLRIDPVESRVMAKTVRP